MLKAYSKGRLRRQRLNGFARSAALAQETALDRVCDGIAIHCQLDHNRLVGVYEVLEDDRYDTFYLGV